MVLPGYSIYFVFILVPIFATLFLSFTNYDFSSIHVVGFSNYVRLVHDPDFKISVLNTTVFTVSTIMPQMAFGLLLAAILNQKLFGTYFFRLSIYVPYIISSVAVSMIWLWIYDPAIGVLNKLFMSIGLPQQKWLYDPNLALFCLIVMNVWKFIGFNMVIYMAGLQQIPLEIYDAATVDGANSIHQFFRITIPLLKTTTFFLFIVNFINSANIFEQVQIMTQGNPLNRTTTIVHQIYIRAFRDFQMGYASSMAVILLAITIVFTFSYYATGRKEL